MDASWGPESRVRKHARLSNGRHRIVIAEDYPLLLDAMREHLERVDGVEVVGLAHDGEATLRLIDEQQPDLLVLDGSLPDMGSPEAVQRARDYCPGVAVLVVAERDDPADRRALLDLHIEGYLPKTTTIAGFLAAVRLIGEGGQVIANSPALTPPDATAPLTAREAEVLHLLGSGSTNGEIAARLCLALKTVEFHIRNIYRKLNVRGRVHAIREAQRAGLLGPY